jgi:hypothetical protein
VSLVQVQSPLFSFCRWTIWSRLGAHRRISFWKCAKKEAVVVWCAPLRRTNAIGGGAKGERCRRGEQPFTERSRVRWGREGEADVIASRKSMFLNMQRRIVIDMKCP